ncbi:glycosyltransferase family 39 protein [Streptomyces sp. 4F14]|uniref:glycosyltransferase family 39 protein n=1 Tax=Streptomyces sp. 4F14 TaxID=3394380 RepID=UPI003A84C6B6
MATTVPAPPAPPWRPLWRSPSDQPAHARPTLLALLALAALLYTWGIGHSSYHAFYADAARSMSENWKAFFYGSFDPGNSITLDKLPGFLWPQALSARLFGFHPWALVLPQVLEGMASVLVLHRLVSRWAGTNAALLTCTAFLLTPVSVGLFRTAVEDPAFTLCLLLAVEATQRAARDGRARTLVVAGVWVGVGFQSKMLEAWAVLPALAVVYLVSAPISLRRRVVHLGVAAVVMTCVSVSWMVAVTLVPAKDRPYVDGTTDNSVFSMVVGYNFLNRFSALGVSAGVTGSVSGSQGGGHRGEADAGAAARAGAGAFGGAGRVQGMRSGEGQRQGQGQGQGQDGWAKMFGASLASQTGWLYPFAAVCAVCGLVWSRGRPRTDGPRAGFLLWGTWLATFFLVFSAGSVGGHTYYMGVIAVPLAALTGGGAVVLWRAYRAGGRRAWALPGAVAATTVWSAYLAGEFTSFLPWLAPVVGVLGVTAVVLLAVARPGGRRRAGGRLALAGLATALAALLIAPGAWVAQVFNPSYRNTGMGAVGPSRTGGGRGAFTSFERSAPEGAFASAGGRTGRLRWDGGRGERADGDTGTGTPGGFGGIGSDGGLTMPQRELLAYTTAHQGSAPYVFATTNWTTASPYILATGAHVLPLGGFSGRVPFPTETGFQRLVRDGEVRYVVVGGVGRTSNGATAAARITQWVRSACAPVPSSDYGGTDDGQTLYRCARA